MARKIRELIKSGVRQSDIAVISYKTKYFMPLLPYLKARPEIKIAYEKRDNLFEDEAIHQVLTLARFVCEMKNEQKNGVSILEILAYPFFGLPILEVMKITDSARQNHRSIFESLADSENPKIRAVAEFLAGLVSRAFVDPLEIMIDYIIGATELNGYLSPLLQYYSEKDEYSAFSLYENLASLRGKLHKHFGDKSLKLDDLINMVDDYEMAEMTLDKTSPYRDAEDAVQILSAHKAKGLEFEYVFIISADHMAWGKGKGNNNLLALPKNLAHIRHTGTTDGERLRILYVSLTRAKSTLYITNSLRDFNGKSPDRLEYLDEYSDGERVVSPLIPDGIVDCHYEESASVSSAITEVNRLKYWMAPYVKLSPDMKALYHERVKNWRMSASSLTSFIDIVYAGPMEFFKRQILKAPSEPETESLAFGDLIHKTFEVVTNRNVSDEKAMDFFLSELEKKELTPEVIQGIKDKGLAALKISLEKFGDILRCGKAEVNLSPEKLSIDGVPVTGKIDHMIIDDEAKTIEIYDFKTGGYHKEKWHSHATLYKYMLQLGFYKLLLNTSLTYSKYKIERAHILFVTPDKDDEVYDKIYEFNEDDERALIELMRSVYSEVISLDFIDDPEIFVQPNENLGIKDIKEFITLLLAKSSTK